MSVFLKYFSDKVTKRQRTVLEQIILCNSKRLGLKIVYCPECNGGKKIFFSCKSGYCPYCGRNANKEFIQKFVDRMLGVTHRHLTMTMSDKLWKIFKEDPKLQRKLIKAAHATIGETMFIFTGKKLVPGSLVVIHTYGKDLKTNVHVHVIVTEGGYLKGTKEWVPFTYFPFVKKGKVWRTMNQIWMDNVLELVETSLPQTSGNKRFIKHFRKRYKHGFYIYGPSKERIFTTDSRRAKAKYITRYVKHPIISDARISRYNEKTVTFWYHDKDKRKVSVEMDTLEFIFKVVQHIPPKNFRLVNFYGIYANATKKEIIIQTVFNESGNAIDPKDIPKDKERPKWICRDCKSECIDVHLISYVRKSLSYRILTFLPSFVRNNLPGLDDYGSEIKWNQQLRQVIELLRNVHPQKIITCDFG